MPQVMPKQITYPNVAIEVQPGPEGSVALVIMAPGEVLVFPMVADYAAELGRKLTAPRVVPASAPAPSVIVGRK
jgi:hypothetical protein